MGDFIKLTAKDGHSFSAYEKKPAGKVRGGLVVIQEIFGVNAHIRRVADGYADDGYHVISPAIFDRAERDVDLGYEKAEMEHGVALRQKITLDQMLADVAASIAAVKSAGKVGIVGYCLGGSLAWLSACRLDGLSAAIGYYGGMIAANLADKPRCPVLLHFGEKDGGIPMTDVAKIKAAVDPKHSPDLHLCRRRPRLQPRRTPANWHGESARVARDRTIAFLRQHVG